MTTFLELDQILTAIVFAARKHQGQVRKDEQKSPYVTHPILVAQALWQIGGITDLITLIAAILHDTIEDTQTTPAELRENFGDEVLQIVMEVTDDKSKEKLERKRLQVVHAPNLSQQAKSVKLGDKLINCRDILFSPPKDWPLQRRREYFQWSADVVSRLRNTNSALEQAFDQVLSEAESLLDFTIQPFATIDQRPWAP